MIDEKYKDHSAIFDPYCTSLQAAAIRAGERQEARDQARREAYEQGLVDPCKCTWEKPDPQEAYDNETISMWRAKNGGWSSHENVGLNTFTKEEMSRRP